MGPRQVGKTTMILQLIERLSFKSKYITADDVPAAYRNWLRNAWDDIRRQLMQSAEKTFLLIVD